MDAFFASIEQRDRPELRGKPIAVGGSPGGRGVVAAASYEARVFGVRSAMSSSRAQSLCPDLLFVRPRFEVYQRISRTVMGILRSFTDQIEPVSIDEAFLDVTKVRSEMRYASQIAKAIRARIHDFSGLTASAGVAPNKFLAKIASDMNKPNGLTVIQPSEVEEFLKSLPVRRIPGVGKVTEEKMLQSGISVVGQLQSWSEKELVSKFGKQGGWFYRVARGQDDRPVVVSRERKSVSAECTFERDIAQEQELVLRLREVSSRVFRRYQKGKMDGKCVTLKVKYSDFEQITRSKTGTTVIQSESMLCGEGIRLLTAMMPLPKPVRLLGLGIQLGDANETDDMTSRQLRLFE
jgi:DNA polymerase-4